MSLDFTGIENIAFKGENQSNDGKDGKAKYNLLESEKKERANARKAYASYQNAIKKAGMLRRDILKGIKAGEDPLALLLKATEVISLMTEDKTFYSQSTEDIKAVYGWGLGEPAPLKTELKDARKRIQKMKYSLTGDLSPEVEGRIKSAIKAHEDLIKSLEEKIKSE